ncbi:MAG: hypothetical protein PUA49_02335 [Butyrivibrio sp.]|nr:hypothetical protein [Butyrivibrio sp.]
MKKGKLRYVMRTVGAADKGLVWYTIFKNAMEKIFLVFFFVYLTKYVFDCIEIFRIPDCSGFW